MRQILLQNPTAILLQNATVQLQNATKLQKASVHNNIKARAYAIVLLGRKAKLPKKDDKLTDAYYLIQEFCLSFQN